jgi:hypothetical protein
VTWTIIPHWNLQSDRGPALAAEIHDELALVLGSWTRIWP